MITVSEVRSKLAGGEADGVILTFLYHDHKVVGR